MHTGRVARSSIVLLLRDPHACHPGCSGFWIAREALVQFERLKWGTEPGDLPFNHQMQCPHGKPALTGSLVKAHRVSASTWGLIRSHFSSVTEVGTSLGSCKACLDEVGFLLAGGGVGR